MKIIFVPSRPSHVLHFRPTNKKKLKIPRRCRTEKTDGREDGTSETEGTTEILDTGTRENAIEETEGIEIGRETEQEEGKMKGIIIQTAVKSENVQRKGQSAERKRNQENR